MVSPASVKAYAAGAHATYVELDSGHFAMLFCADAVERAIDDFVGEL
jgi:hypothetical protein